MCISRKYEKVRFHLHSNVDLLHYRILSFQSLELGLFDDLSPVDEEEDIIYMNHVENMILQISKTYLI